jgi:two-component system CheB/CheR fusion protein
MHVAPVQAKAVRAPVLSAVWRHPGPTSSCLCLLSCQHEQIRRKDDDTRELPDSASDYQPRMVPSDLRFPVVGLGASAGGVEALQTFFETAPASMDMAFVVILHLSAQHLSHADEILQRVTSMPVHQVTSTLPIEKNHIYVISPGKQLEMSDGCVRVSEREASDHPPLTINRFFRSLAQAHSAYAVAIVLSGSGSDGAAGVSRIKEAGGITLAQEPDDAAHPEMPQAAIATGHVDVVLPVAELI